MTRRVNFEPPTDYEPVTCPDDNDGGPECVEFHSCEMCDQLLCPTHSDEEEVVACASGMSLHHLDCAEGCLECRWFMQSERWADLHDDERAYA